MSRFSHEYWPFYLLQTTKTVVRPFHFASLYNRSPFSLPAYEHIDFWMKLNGPAHFIALMHYLPDIFLNCANPFIQFKFHIIPERELSLIWAFSRSTKSHIIVLCVQTTQMLCARSWQSEVQKGHESRPPTLCMGVRFPCCTLDVLSQKHPDHVLRHINTLVQTLLGY